VRDLYYADNRDLVKWGVLVELAARHGARHILQVLYYRPTEWPDLEIDGKAVPLPESVRTHFRNARSICGLQCTARVETIDDPFVSRGRYLELVVNRIRARVELPGIVFLDPDTGLQPRSPGLEHVLESELTCIWQALQAEDLLVLYQHQTNRNGEPWVEPKQIQFVRALGLPAADVGVARGPDIAPDVAFFFASKHATVAQAEPTEPTAWPSPSHNVTLQDVVACLNATKTRATYSAVAAVVGGLARGIGQRLGRRRPEASWIVSSNSGLPSGYTAKEMHSELSAARLVTTGEELKALLEHWRSRDPT
jgi:hypothetical protein